jgi:hypothetical protein
MWKKIVVLASVLACLAPCAAWSQAPAPALAAPIVAPVYDAALAASLGANENGMRSYVLVLLKTGPRTMPKGAARDEMFKGHFANIGRLAGEKKLVLAGPLDGVEGLRGVFVFATADIEQARREVDTDPVITNGEMVAEYHKFFSSAGLMMVNDVHSRLIKK